MDHWIYFGLIGPAIACNLGLHSCSNYRLCPSHIVIRLIRLSNSINLAVGPYFKYIIYNINIINKFFDNFISS